MFAFTAHASATPGGFDIISLLPIFLIFIVFYFLIFRPQQKKNKTHQEMIKNIKKGDRVMTASGFYGVVDKVISDQEIQLEIADGVKVRFVKSMIHEVLDKKSPSLVINAQDKSQETKDIDSEKVTSMTKQSNRKKKITQDA